MAGELAGKVAAVTGAASGIGLASSEAMLAAGARGGDGRPRRSGAEEAQREARRGRDPARHQPARPEGLRDYGAENYREGWPARHPARQRRPLCRRRPRRDRHDGHRPDAQPQHQRGDEERARRAAAHDRAPDGRHHRHEFARGAFSDAMGAGLRVVQMGDQLLRPDGAAAGVQARHSRRLDLARTRHHRAARRLAAREAQGSEGVGQPARGRAKWPTWSRSC